MKKVVNNSTEVNLVTKKEFNPKTISINNIEITIRYYAKNHQENSVIIQKDSFILVLSGEVRINNRSHVQGEFCTIHKDEIISLESLQENTSILTVTDLSIPASNPSSISKSLIGLSYQQIHLIYKHIFDNKKLVYSPQEKIRIHFLYIYDSFWTAWRSFYEACCADPEIEVRVILLNGKGVLNSSQIRNQRTFLNKNYISFTDYTDYDLNLELPHLLVYSNPYDYLYDNYFPKFKITNVLELGIRPIYISYGCEFDEDYPENKYLKSIQCRQDVQCLAWRMFVMHNDIKNSFYRDCPNGGNHIRVYGAPKFDVYFQSENLVLDPVIKDKSRGRKIVCYQIHAPNNNNVSEVDCKQGRYHTLNFEEHNKIIQSLIDNFKDLFFIITIHPAFESECYQRKLFDQDGFNQFILRLRTAENIYLYTETNYQPLIANADAFITENSSLMIEMAFFDNPVLYLFDVPVKMKNFARKLVNTFYTGSSANDVEYFLRKKVCGSFDLYSQRKLAQHEIFKNYDGRIGQRILDSVLVDFKCNL